MFIRIAQLALLLCFALLVLGAEDYYKVCQVFAKEYKQQSVVHFKLYWLLTPHATAARVEERCFRTRDKKGLQEPEQEVPSRQESVRPRLCLALAAINQRLH